MRPDDDFTLEEVTLGLQTLQSSFTCRSVDVGNLQS